MAERPYTNRELDLKFGGLDGKLDDTKDVIVKSIADFETSASAALSEIKEQTTKTNGRVTSLEKTVQDQDTANQVFRARIYTAVTILTFLLGTILVPIAAAYISTESNTTTQQAP
jgi:hypothetical protein